MRASDALRGGADARTTTSCPGPGGAGGGTAGGGGAASAPSGAEASAPASSGAPASAAGSAARQTPASTPMTATATAARAPRKSGLVDRTFDMDDTHGQRAHATRTRASDWLPSSYRAGLGTGSRRAAVRVSLGCRLRSDLERRSAPATGAARRRRRPAAGAGTAPARAARRRSAPCCRCRATDRGRRDRVDRIDLGARPRHLAARRSRCRRPPGGDGRRGGREGAARECRKTREHAQECRAR
jgi:hypothetical protein